MFRKRPVCKQKAIKNILKGSDISVRKCLSLLFYIAIILLFLSGCTSSPNQPKEMDWKPSEFETVNDIDDVSMILDEGTVLSTRLTVILENHSDREYIYTEYMWLEKKIDGEWYQVPTIIDDYGFQDIAYMLAAGEAKDEVIDWAWLYGELEKGEYRLIKHVFPSDTEEHNPYYLAVEFEITN